MPKSFMTRSECVRQHENIMQEFKEFKDKLDDVKFEVAKLPEKLIEKMDGRYVLKDVFDPIKKIVYGLVGAILLAFVAGLLALVWRT